LLQSQMTQVDLNINKYLDYLNLLDF